MRKITDTITYLFSFLIGFGVVTYNQSENRSFVKSLFCKCAQFSGRYRFLRTMIWIVEIQTCYFSYRINRMAKVSNDSSFSLLFFAFDIEDHPVFSAIFADIAFRQDRVSDNGEGKDCDNGKTHWKNETGKNIPAGMRSLLWIIPNGSEEILLFHSCG